MHFKLLVAGCYSMASKRISEDMFKNICQNLLHHPERMLRDKKSLPVWICWPRIKYKNIIVDFTRLQTKTYFYFLNFNITNLIFWNESIYLCFNISYKFTYKEVEDNLEFKRSKTHRGSVFWRTLWMPLTPGTFRYSHVASYQCVWEYFFPNFPPWTCTHTHEELLKGGYFYFCDQCKSSSA